MTRTLLALVLAVFALAACGGEDGGASLPVEFSRSGGIDGDVVALKIEADGRATLATLPGERQTTFTLSDAERKDVVDELGKVDLASIKPEGDGEIVDGYQYSVVAGGQRVEVEDGSAPDEILPLLAALGKVVDAHRP